MLDQIASLVKEYGQQSVVENADISEKDNNLILAEATNTITGGMQNMLAGGGLQDIISMFTGGGNNNQQSGSGISGLLKNPIVSMMVGHLINKLVSKFNLSPAQASNISNQLVPNVLSNLVNRTNSYEAENDGFDMNDLIGSLTGNKGGSGFDFQDLLKQFSGGGTSGGNGFDLQDILQNVTQGAQDRQSEQSKNSGGGLTDLIKGFFN